MKEISEGQVWYSKSRVIDSWGGIHIRSKLENDEWIVDIYTEPMSVSVMTSSHILECYIFKYEKNNV
jgi:hypothetical protein